MSKFRFAACPRCQGDIYLDHNMIDEWYEMCLQCGHLRYLDVIAEGKHPDDDKPKMQTNKKEVRNGNR
jgi:hypothetical protein